MRSPSKVNKQTKQKKQGELHNLFQTDSLVISNKQQHIYNSFSVQNILKTFKQELIHYSTVWNFNKKYKNRSSTNLKNIESLSHLSKEQNTMSHKSDFLISGSKTISLPLAYTNTNRTKVSPLQNQHFMSCQTMSHKVLVGWVRSDRVD